VGIYTIPLSSFKKYNKCVKNLKNKYFIIKMMILIYIIRYCLFVYSLYRLTVDENEKSIEYVNYCTLRCGPLAIKLLQLIVMSNPNNVIKTNKLNFVFEDCEIHSFEKTQEMYFQEYQTHITDDYEIVDNIISSGSIGQVYKAYCKRRNEYVAIKVKHPYINDNVNKTVQALKIVCYLLKCINKFHYIFIQYINNIYLQIDYINEAIHTKQLKYKFRNEECIVIPEIYSFSSNFIIMSYHEGKMYKDISNDRQLIASLYINFFYISSLLIHDYLHGDLHFGNWKIIEDGNDIKLLIYDCGLIFSSGSLDLNKEILNCVFNRLSLINLLDIINRVENNKNSKKIEKSRSELKKIIIPGDNSPFNNMTKFFHKLCELGLVKNENLINILSSIAIIGDTPGMCISTISKYTHNIVTNTNSILFHTYVGLLERINKFNDLKNYFINEIESNQDYKEVYKQWLYEEFGHTNVNILNQLIYKKFFL